MRCQKNTSRDAQAGRRQAARPQHIEFPRPDSTPGRREEAKAGGTAGRSPGRPGRSHTRVAIQSGQPLTKTGRVLPEPGQEQGPGRFHQSGGHKDPQGADGPGGSVQAHSGLPRPWTGASAGPFDRTGPPAGRTGESAAPGSKASGLWRNPIAGAACRSCGSRPKSGEALPRRPPGRGPGRTTGFLPLPEAGRAGTARRRQRQRRR